MKVMVARTAYIRSAGIGYTIGLNQAGDRIEFMGDWRTLSELGAHVSAETHPQPADVEEWQILAVNGELRLPLPSEAMAERAAFLRMVLDVRPDQG
jgi:hypothetical protein